MKRSNRLIILIGVLLAVGGFMGAVVIAGSGGGGGGTSTPTATPEATTTVVVANKDINYGDLITESMVDEKTVTISQAAAYGVDTYTSRSQVVGKLAGAKITAGQPLAANRDILTPGTMPDGKSITSGIAPGMVAISIEVDQVNGVGTLIVPGDHVNVIYSVDIAGVAINFHNAQDKPILALSNFTDPSVKLIVQNRKVLGTIVTPAVSTNTTTQVGASPGAGPTATNAKVQLSDRHEIVILEVKNSEAEVIRWCQRAEKLDPQNYITMALVLRSDKDNTAPDTTTTGVTFKMLVDKWGVLPLDGRAYVPADLLQIVNKLATW